MLSFLYGATSSFCLVGKLFNRIETTKISIGRALRHPNDVCVSVSCVLSLMIAH
jgi:hypothetical protein